MAETQTSSKQEKLARGKLILIAVLAVVLVVVLYIQFGSSGTTPGSEAAGYRPPGHLAASQPTGSASKNAAASEGKAPGGNAVNAVPIIDPTRWKSPDLPIVIAYDPFALPPAFPQPPRIATNAKAAGAEGLIAAATADDAKKLAEAVEKLRMQLEELQQRGVHVIVREGDQYAAVIGDRMLHVGDKINDFTVTAIDPSGVRVERKESP